MVGTITGTRRPVRLLHVVSSPRGADSVSRAVTDAFVAAYREVRSDLEVDTLDVWEADLPEFDGRRIGVKYKLVSGEELDDDEAAAWRAVQDLIARFEAADRIVLGVPMWNWSYPYKLKQLIDLVSQRDRLFTFDGHAYGPALDVGRALVVGVRGQSDDAGLAGAAAQACDHQLDFLRFWLQVIGVHDVWTLRVQHTWDALAPQTLAEGLAEARSRARDF